MVIPAGLSAQNNTCIIACRQSRLLRHHAPLPKLTCPTVHAHRAHLQPGIVLGECQALGGAGGEDLLDLHVQG